MVRAIFDGRKTQTRRVVKNAHIITCDDRTGATDKRCPYGSPGDLLWVREKFSPCGCVACRKAWPGQPDPATIKQAPHGVVHEATYIGHSGIAWRPSIHMPRWACRLVLRVAEVRVQRLQEISRADAEAEGVYVFDTPCANNETKYRAEFASRWDFINGNGAWDKNPWAWAITFEVAAKTQAEAQVLIGGLSFPDEAAGAKP
jgi:hypothetical protein